MATSTPLSTGRDAFQRHDWTTARHHLAAADQERPLEPDDLERLAIASALLGLDAEADALWSRTHQEFLARNEIERAVRCAFWMGFRLLDRNVPAQAEGWIARGRRLLDELNRATVEAGYLLIPQGITAIGTGDLAGARELFRRAVAIGTQFGDRDLTAIARHGEGRVLIRMGDPVQGLRLLDEVMVSVMAGDVVPLVVGDIYCSVLSGCQEVFDIGRAREWTAAMHTWCGGQQGLVAYQGQCLVRRAEILQLGGAWADALAEAERACAHFARSPGQPGGGAACYQLGELYRLRGEWDRAEAAYRDASRQGRRPQPGMALLRLAQGQVAAALVALRNALDETTAPRSRAQLLPAAVYIMLSAGETDAARKAADELGAIAATLDSALLSAAAAQSNGMVQLAEEDTRAALISFRRAASGWRDLNIPYEVARTGVLVSLALARLGDQDTADLELAAAGTKLQELGASAEESRLRMVYERTAAAGGLTDRERQVLALVASGLSNRVIAGQLAISEKTVARHISNIFTKLDLSSRAAATAYAYQHGLK